MTQCLTCELIRRRDEGAAPLWDSIARTPFWDIVHASGTSLPGWLVLVARRHIAALDEMSEPEAVDLGVLIRRVSLALKEATGCTKTYVAQFAEADEHQHVHFHVIPRMPDQSPDDKGSKIFRHLGVAEADRVDEAAMNHIGERVREHLANTSLPQNAS